MCMMEKTLFILWEHKLHLKKDFAMAKFDQI